MSFRQSTLFAVLLLLLLSSINISMAADTENHAIDAVQKGWEHIETGDLETAAKRFHQATILDPKFAPGYFGKAYVFSLQNQLDPAIENYRKTIELADPPYAPAYANLGLALMMKGDRPEALLMLKQSLSIDPNHADAHVHLAQFYCSESNGRQAWLHLDKARTMDAAIDPGLPAAMMVRCPKP